MPKTKTSSNTFFGQSSWKTDTIIVLGFVIFQIVILEILFYLFGPSVMKWATYVVLASNTATLVYALIQYKRYYDREKLIKDTLSEAGVEVQGYETVAGKLIPLGKKLEVWFDDNKDTFHGIKNTLSRINEIEKFLQESGWNVESLQKLMKKYNPDTIVGFASPPKKGYTYCPVVREDCLRKDCPLSDICKRMVNL